jgi:hypothetical protein
LAAAPFAERPIAALGMAPVITSQIRLISSGDLDPREINFLTLSSELPPETVLLVGENWRDEVAAAGYRLIPAGYRAKRVGAKEVWRAWRSGRREDSFDSNRQNYYIAVRP